MNQIEVMKQALEAIATGKGKFEAITALRQASEQAETNTAKLNPCPDHSDGRHIWDFDGGCYGKNCKAHVMHPPTAPTAPAQPSNHTEQPLDMVKALQPLTDEQLDLLWREITLESLYDSTKRFARAIEAAHGIKGASL